MKKISLYILIILGISSLFINCEDPNKGDNFSIYEGMSIGEYLEQSEDFTLWTAMLKKANLFNALTIKTKFTCFIAKDDAVRAYLAEKGYASIDAIDDDVLTYLMRYHVIEGIEFPSTTMANGKLSDTTVSGDYLVTRYTDGGDIEINDRAKIINKDIELLNGVAHVLDKTLDPIIETVWDFVREDANYSIFAEAIQKTGYIDILELIRVRNGAKNYTTVFIVPDAVFHANGIMDINDLIDTYAFGNYDFLDSLNVFNKYVGYHMVGGMQSFNDLAEFTTDIKKKNIATYANNELITIEDINGELIFNREQDQIGYRFGTNINIPVRNGMIHEVDGLLPIYSPEPTVFKMEFTDANYYPQFAALPWYGKGASAGQGQTNDITMEDFPFIRWSTTPEGVGRVWYECRGTWPGFFDSADVLAANMGAVGWWEMDLPAIVKGRYKVEIKHHYANSRGTYQVSMDGKNLGAPVVFNYNGYTHRTTNVGIVNFLETSTHTIRFTVVSPGLMEVDWITFTPVD